MFRTYGCNIKFVKLFCEIVKKMLNPNPRKIFEFSEIIFFGIVRIYFQRIKNSISDKPTHSFNDCFKLILSLLTSLWTYP